MLRAQIKRQIWVGGKLCHQASDPPKAASRSSKNPTPRNTPDDRRFSHPQQRTNQPHVVDCVGPFPGMNISGNISLPCETDSHCFFAIETGTLNVHPVGSTTSVMTPILASTRSAFFQQYNFDFDPRATLHTEFCRLAKIRKWKQGSNSKMFEKAWNQCFGSEAPIGYNTDTWKNLIRAQYGADKDDFLSILGSLQSLDLEGGTHQRKVRAQMAGTEFASHYGTDARVTEKWQALCQDCGVNPIPPSINQSKKVQPLQ